MSWALKFSTGINIPIAITEIGEAIVLQSRVILSECNKIQELINSDNNTVTGSYRMAVIPTIAPYILPSLLRSYSVKYPEVKLEVREMETKQIIRALLNNELDIALVSTPLEENGIKEYPLFNEAFIAYFSKDEKALKKRMVNADDIALDRMWLLNEGHCMRNQVIDLCSDQIKKMQAERPYQYESSNVETLRKMVDSNSGMTVLPELATFDFNEDQAERIRYFEDPEPVREVSLITNNYFIKMSLLESLKEQILSILPEKMHVQKKNRKVLRIQSARL
jgi:LysR family transcriptional regulator, hydrogen peroxide-inducible genes activator